MKGWIYPGAMMIALIGVLVSAGCGGNDDGDDGSGPTSETTEPADGQGTDYSGVVITTEQTTGPNRFAVGVLNDDGVVLGADVSLTFLKVTSDNTGEVRSQSDAEFVELERFRIDGNGEKITSGATGAYVTQVEFDETGDWAVQIIGSDAGDEFGPITLAFGVAPSDEVLNVGDPAPKSRQAISADVSDISEIDSMVPSDPMHDLTVSDASASGQPTVILFGTPAFCETEVCGPVMEAVMLPAYEAYGDRANFIHVEPFFLEEMRAGNGFCAVPAYNLNLARTGVPQGPGPCPSLTEEELLAVGESWNLNTEPIIFVLDSQGNIAGKFEGVVGPVEIERILTALLDNPA